jgi:hypothetical protein
LPALPNQLTSRLNPVQLKYCALTDESGNSADYLTVGKPGSITLGFAASRHLKEKDVVFMVVIENAQKEKIGCLASPGFHDLPVQGEVRCLIPRVPLVPGRYTFTPACRVGSEWFDGGNQTVVFEVRGTEFYSTHKLPPEGIQGRVLLDYDWLIS